MRLASRSRREADIGQAGGLRCSANNSSAILLFPFYLSKRLNSKLDTKDAGCNLHNQPTSYNITLQLERDQLHCKTQCSKMVIAPPRLSSRKELTSKASSFELRDEQHIWYFRFESIRKG